MSSAFSATLNLNSNFSNDQIFNVVFDGSNGTFTVAPGPSSIALAAFGFVGLMAWGWRSKC